MKAAVKGAENKPAGTGGSTPAASSGETDGLLNGETQPSGKTSQGTDEAAQTQADKTANEKLKNGENLAKTVNTKNTNASSVSSAAAKRGSFSTMEGSIQVAAGIAVNIHSNISRAEIIDAADVEADGDITVLSRNDTDAQLKSNASTTNSYVGVGVAVATNLVEHQNLAMVGNGKLIAGGKITVAAEIYERSESDALERAYDILVDYLIQEGKLETVLGAVGDNALKTSAAYRFLNEEKNMEVLAQAVKDMIDIALWQEDLNVEEQIEKDGVVVEGAGQRTLRELVENLITAKWVDEESSLSIEHAYGLEQYIIAQLVENHTGEENPYAEYETKHGYDSYTAELIEELEIMMDYTAGKMVEGYQLMPLILKLAQNENAALTQEEKTQLDAYLMTEGSTDAEKESDRYLRAKAAKELMINQIVASLTGEEQVASQNAQLYADAFGDMVEDIFTAFADSENWKLEFDFSLDPNTQIVTLPVIQEIQAEFTQLGLSLDKMYNALSGLLADKFGSLNELDGVGHTISTQAISGVGASSVGVAGSAAVTQITSVSQASIAGRDVLNENEYDIQAVGELRVEADEAQLVYTTATASADKSLGYAAKAATARKPGSSVGVGASFAVNLIESSVIARIGTETVTGQGDDETVSALGNRNIKSGSLAILATYRDDVDTVTVAGSDPIARRDKAYQVMPTLGGLNDTKALAQAANQGTNTKGISADAAVAVALVESQVKAQLLKGSRLETTAAADTIESGILTGTDAAGEELYAMANVLVQALYSGESSTEVSAFAAASRAAIGAAVGYYHTESDIQATLDADTQASGSVRVHAAANHTDESYAMATSIGADLNRILEKFREGLNYISPGASEVSTLRNKIVAAGNKLGASSLESKMMQGGASAQRSFVKSIPFSSNLLKLLHIDFDKSTNQASSLSTSAATAAGNGVSGAQVTTPTSSINVAAAVGLAFTEHNILSQILSDVSSKTGDVEAGAINNANFRTRATGATITTAPAGANTAAAAVAVTVNRNSAKAYVADGVSINAKGDVDVTAHSSQNTTGYFPAYMSAQAIAASIATGMKGTLGLAGAVAVLSAYADSIAQIGDDVSVTAGGDILVEAIDFGKLAIRALGANIGRQTLGVGAAAAMLYADSNIHALIGDDFTAQANSLTVNAQRPLVDESLYEFPFDWSDLLTINSTSSAATNPKKGLFDITLPEQLNQLNLIKIECTIGTDNVMDIFDMINHLAMVNYYVEAVSGSINTSAQTTANLAGTLAALFAGNSVRAEIGDNASLTLNKNDKGDGLSVTADSAATTRIIAGGVSIGAPKASVGAAVSLADISDKVSASIGDVTDGSKISSAGNVKVSANADNELWNGT